MWPQHRRIDLISMGILVILLLVLTYGLVQAVTVQLPPAQEFLNGVFTEDIKALTLRIEHIETMTNYVLTAIVGTLIVQLLQVRLHFARRVLDSSRSILEP